MRKPEAMEFVVFIGIVFRLERVWTDTSSAHHMCSCTVVAQIARLCVQSYHARAMLKIGVHLCVPHETLQPLRATSYTLQHSTPCTGTPSSPLPVERSEKTLPRSTGHSSEALLRNCHLPTGFEPNRIVDDQNNMHFTEDGQFTERE